MQHKGRSSADVVTWTGPQLGTVQGCQGLGGDKQSKVEELSWRQGSCLRPKHRSTGNGR